MADYVKVLDFSRKITRRIHPLPRNPHVKKIPAIRQSAEQPNQANFPLGIGQETQVQKTKGQETQQKPLLR
jgi:hypothetical protein